MLTVPHMVVGAALGSLVSDGSLNNVIAFGSGWVAHYVLDAIPHWERFTHRDDFHNFETDLPPQQWPRVVLAQAILDVVTAFVLVFWIVSQRGDLPFWESAVFWGAIGGSFPDFIGNTPPWNRYLYRLPFFRQEKDFHQYIHISQADQKKVGKYTGLLTQIAALALSYYVLFGQ